LTKSCSTCINTVCVAKDEPQAEGEDILNLKPWPSQAFRKLISNGVHSAEASASVYGGLSALPGRAAQAAAPTALLGAGKQTEAKAPSIPLAETMRSKSVHSALNLPLRSMVFKVCLISNILPSKMPIP